MFGPVLLNEDDWVWRLGPCRFQFWACRLIGPLTYRMGSIGVWAKAHGTHNAPLFPAGEVVLPWSGKENTWDKFDVGIGGKR